MANDKPTGISKEQLNIQEQFAKHLKDASKSAAERRKEAQATLEILERQLELSKQAPDNLRTQLDLEKQIADQRAKMAKTQLDVAIEQLELAKKNTATKKDRLEKLEKEVKLQREVAEAQAQSAKDLSITSSHATSLLKRFTGITDQSQSFSAVLSRGVGPAISGLLKNMSSLMTPLNIVSSLLSKIYQTTALMVASMEKQAAETAKLTGQSRQYAQTIFDASVANRSFGISLGETGDAFRALYSDMAAFSNLNKPTQERLTVTASKLAKLGISLSDQAQNMNMFTKGMGMTAIEAQNVQMEIADLAKTIGEPVAKLAAGFKASMQTLQVYGSRGVEIFKKLAAQAKGLGIEVGKLTSTFGSSMDTFEGSADVAGKLNTILGKDMVSSVRLLYATEAQRVDMIRQSVAASGKSWQSMTKFQKLAVMNAAGIKDMTMANKLFGTSSEVYELNKIRAEEAAASQERLNKMLLPAIAFWDKLKVSVTNLAVAVMPLIKLLGFVVDQLGGFFKGVGIVLGAVEKFIKTFPGWIAGFAGVTLAVWLLNAAYTKWIVSAFVATTATRTLGQSLKAMGKAGGLMLIITLWAAANAVIDRFSKTLGPAGVTILKALAAGLSAAGIAFLFLNAAGGPILWTIGLIVAGIAALVVNFKSVKSAIMALMSPLKLLKKAWGGIKGFFGRMFGSKTQKDIAKATKGIKGNAKALGGLGKEYKKTDSPAVYQMPEAMAEGNERLAKKAEIASVKIKKVADSTKKIKDATGKKQENFFQSIWSGTIMDKVADYFLKPPATAAAGAGATADVKRNIVITFNPDRDAPAFKEAVLHVINTHKR